MAESFNEASLDLGEGIHPFPVVTIEGVDDRLALRLVTDDEILFESLEIDAATRSVACRRCFIPLQVGIFDFGFVCTEIGTSCPLPGRVSTLVPGMLSELSTAATPEVVASFGGAVLAVLGSDSGFVPVQVHSRTLGPVELVVGEPLWTSFVTFRGRPTGRLPYKPFPASGAFLDPFLRPRRFG